MDEDEAQGLCQQFGMWRAVENNWGFDGGAPTITAEVGTFEITLVLSKGDRFVSAHLYDEAIDGMPESAESLANGVHVAPWTRSSVLCVLEATAALAIAAAGGGACSSCGGVNQGHTCCPEATRPSMVDLAEALDAIAIEREWWDAPVGPARSREKEARHASKAGG